MFLTPEQMYEEQGKLRAAHKHYQNADIYFLTRMQKVRFEPKKFRVSRNGEILGVLSLGDPTGICKKLNFSFPPLEALYSMKHISPQFKDLEHFFVYALVHIYKPKCVKARLAYWMAQRLYKRKLFSKLVIFLMKWSYSRDLHVVSDSPYEICFVDPIASQLIKDQKVEELKSSSPEVYKKYRTLQDSEWDTERLKTVDFSKLKDFHSSTLLLPLTVDQVVSHFDIDVGNQEILYIGKTEREPFERLLPHEKLQELQSKFLRNDGEAIVIHLLGFQKNDIDNGIQKPTSLSRTDAITTVESELINYFKPVMNEKYVEDDGKRTWSHIKTLTSSGYEQIATELDIDGQYTKFETAHIKNANPNSHCFITCLTTLRRNILSGSNS